MLAITYDEERRLVNLAKHRIDFADAGLVFDGVTYDFEDRRKDFGETRMISIGQLIGRMVMVVWTERSESRRIISMRKCNDREQALYRPRFPQGRA